ncbi:P-loop containing nucleoside triphosphate hydrolase protein [Chiua virens]|nr:P-loop containing nucleoside triphosphate hydrolase protein [Chiua virens]
MRLQSLIPTIPSDLVAALEACGVRTEADLLFSGTPIDILQRLPPGTVSLADLKTYITLVAQSTSAPGVQGNELYEQELHRRRDCDTDITCGVNELDALVGGFGNGRVFEISGDRGSGKTTLVLQIALRLLVAQRETSVLWMDTIGDFSVERTSQVAQQFHGEGSSTVLERLRVSVVLNIEAAHILLEHLEASLNVTQGHQSNPVSVSRIRLVVIDSVTPLLAPPLSAVSSQGHAIMTTFMQHLRTLARSYYLAFLVSICTFHIIFSDALEVVNNTSASPLHNSLSVFPSTTRKPALGPSFTFLTDCTIWLARREDMMDAEAGESMHAVEIFKSRATVRNYGFTIRLSFLLEPNLAIKHVVHVQNSEWSFAFGDMNMTRFGVNRWSSLSNTFLSRANRVTGKGRVDSHTGSLFEHSSLTRFLRIGLSSLHFSAPHPGFNLRCLPPTHNMHRSLGYLTTSVIIGAQVTGRLRGKIIVLSPIIALLLPAVRVGTPDTRTVHASHLSI